jgi:hypothetical protein
MYRKVQKQYNYNPRNMVCVRYTIVNSLQKGENKQ